MRMRVGDRIRVSGGMLDGWIGKVAHFRWKWKEKKWVVVCRLIAMEIYSKKRSIELFYFDKPHLMAFEPDELEILDKDKK